MHKLISNTDTIKGIECLGYLIGLCQGKCPSVRIGLNLIHQASSLMLFSSHSQLYFPHSPWELLLMYLQNNVSRLESWFANMSQESLNFQGGGSRASGVGHIKEAERQWYWVIFVAFHTGIHLFFDTHLRNAYYVSCTGIGPKNTAVNNIDKVHALCILESSGRR